MNNIGCYIMKIYNFKAISIILLALFAYSCNSYTPPRGYEMQRDIWEEEEEDTTVKKQVYLSGTKPIDSVDVNKLNFDIFRIDIKDYPEKLSVYSRVYDDSGKFVTNMADPYKKFPKETYFTSIRERLGKHYNVKNKDVPVFTVREFGAGDSIPYNIALSVDYSGSMEPVMGAIFRGTEIFINMKFPYDKIAISSFNKRYDQKVPMIQDSAEILNMYRMKRKRGYGQFTAIYDAIERNIKLFEDTPSDVPRVMVIFSDGDDNYSKAKIGNLIQKAKDMNINIFTIGFGYCKDENLKMIAEYTGGKFYKAYTEEELVAIFRDLYMSLRFYYLITYQPPKYWGWHHVFAGVNIPKMNDSLLAEGDYDTSGLFAETGNEFELPLLFDFDSTKIKPESFKIIDQIVDQMLSRPRLRLEIQGHTDNIGSKMYNQELSDQRAKNVYDAILEKGIEPRRLRHRGFGYSMPRASNDTEEGRIKNRRTMFKILAK